MLRPPRPLSLLVVLVVAAGASPSWALADLEAADRAFAAGRLDEALALYDGVLESAPDDLHALVRSAMLLSWEREFDEALRRYERVLTLDPGHRRAAFERAKVFSWAGRYDEADSALRTLLESDAGDHEVRLALARSLSWGGNQKEARREYETVLEGRPDDPEVLVGIAQTYAWSGDPARARRWYERAIEEKSGMKEAEIGLAYLDLGAGEVTAALSRTSALEERFPEDREVGELRRAVREARAPWVRAVVDRVDDTDRNDLNIFRVESGWWLAGAVDLRLGIARWDMRDRLDRSASVDSLYAVLGFRPAAGHRLALRLGSDRRENTLGRTRSEAIGGLVYTIGSGSAWTSRLSANRDTFRYSTDILDADVTIDAYEARVTGRPGEQWTVEAGAGRWDLSDGNDRTNLEASGWYEWPVGRTRLQAGYRFRYLDYDDDLDNGYFDPSDFHAHLASVSVRGKLGSRWAYYTVTLETGFQSFTLGGEKVSGDQVFGATGLLGVPLRDGLALELFAASTDFALQSATGFRSRQAAVRIRWQGGRHDHAR